MKTRALLLVLGALVASAPAAAQRAQRRPAAADAHGQAKAHFTRGVAHADRGEWDAALVEFLRSRELFPTPKNTYNAAVCLRRLQRFDEALEMYESLFRDFSGVPAEERKAAERELTELRASVGTIELRGGVPGALVVVDGRPRGALPLSSPIRVGAGTHTVQVTREGLAPFEARVEVAGTQAASVEVTLATLTAGGRLRVVERSGKVLDVVVDGAVVGKTPWEGMIAPAEHVVHLRGADGSGTQPEIVTVKRDAPASIELVAEPLRSGLRAHVLPSSAQVSIDGVAIGAGGWDGRLRPGAHTIEARLVGHRPLRREVGLVAGQDTVVDAVLEPEARAEPLRASFAVELDVGLPLGLATGGELAASCAGACSASPPIGLRAVLHGAYLTGSGVGVGLDLGTLVAFRSLTARPERLAPVGIPSGNAGAVDDALRLAALTVGPSVHYRVDGGGLLLRAGGGLLLGRARDVRTGALETTKGARYEVDHGESDGASYVYVAPELRVGWRLGRRFELDAGVELLMAFALAEPRWRDEGRVPTSNDPRDPGDGIGTFGDRTMFGSFLFFVVPGIGGRFDL